MKTGYRVVAVIAALLLIAWIISCAVNPVTGKRQLMLLSESDEIALGQQTDQEIIATYGVYEDAELNAYINNIGQRMGKITHRPQLPYQFKVLDTPVINAFAVPGGYIYLTRGIVAYLNDEAELAGVIGHELGHVAARHTAVEYSKAQLASLGLGVGMIFSEDFRKYAGLAQFGVSMLFLKFSRDNERQADDLGVEYSSKLYYDANCMATFFETLERLSPADGSNALPEWFSTHPNPTDRLGAVRRKAQEWQGKLAGNTFVTKRKEYLTQVDGVVFGDDPRQGYVDGNAFYHPTLKFYFPVPAQWTVNNTPAQVQMLAPREDAALLFSMVSGTTARDAAAKFVSESSAAVSRNESTTINGMAAQRLLTRVVTQSDTMAVLSHFIQRNSDVFIFHGVSSPAGYAGYANTFSASAGQFKTLTDARRINVTPKTLKVNTAKSATNLSALLAAQGVAREEMETHAIMNGMKLTDAVPAGAMIKAIK